MAKKIFTVTSPEFIEFKKWYEKNEPEAFYMFNDEIVFEIFMMNPPKK